MSVHLIQGDALALPLPDGCVDLIVTSPPYFGLRSYTDGDAHLDEQVGAELSPAAYVDRLVDATREMVRVLKPAGSIWVNLGDKYAERAGPMRPGAVDDDDTVRRAAERPPRGRRDVRVKSLHGLPWRYALACMDRLDLILRAEVIWGKPNAMPESVTDRVRRTHETWFHFVTRPRYYSAIDDIREPHKASTISRGRYGTDHAMRARMLGSPVETRKRSNPWQPSALGSSPGSVWSVATQPLKVPDELGVDHFAAFPMEWPRRLITGWCPPAGTVLDPFGGTGTTALVAHALGRTGISVDRSGDYCRIARWRTTDRGQLAAALQVGRPPEPDHAQGDLFDNPPALNNSRVPLPDPEIRA